MRMGKIVWRRHGVGGGGKWWLVCLLAMGLVACSDDSSGTNQGPDAAGRDAAVRDAALDASLGLDAGGVDSGVQSDASGGDGSVTDAGQVDAGPLSACSDIGALACFSNLDCPDQSTRCENVGTETDPVACCVTGVRGTGQAGDDCDSENDCASAVCIEHDTVRVCSTTCNSEQDCPDGMKNCIFIAFSNSDDKWCLPE